MSASGTGHADFLTFQVQLDLPELTGPFRRSLDCLQLLPPGVELREILIRGGEVGGEVVGLSIRTASVRVEVGNFSVEL